MPTKKISKTLKSWNSIFCRGMVCKTNVKRDVKVVIAAIFVAAAFLFVSLYVVRPQKIQQTAPTESQPVVVSVPTQEEIGNEIENLIKFVSLDSWKTMTNQFWGFTVKYPGDWQAPASLAKTADVKWEARYQFRKKDGGENPYAGYDVAVYDVTKTKQFADTEEFPSMKTAGLSNDSLCQNFEGHAIEVDDFPAEEIYVSANDECFNPALFFSIAKDRYIYNIVPVLKSDSNTDADPRIAVNGNFPEFYSAASTLDLVEVVRPKPAPPKPKITAPRPVSFRVVGGRLVCAKKNDHPRKSRQHKGRHLDMECCLDPDEIPNPWCTY